MNEKWKKKFFNVKEEQNLTSIGKIMSKSGNTKRKNIVTECIRQLWCSAGYCCWSSAQPIGGCPWCWDEEVKEWIYILIIY